MSMRGSIRLVLLTALLSALCATSAFATEGSAVPQKSPNDPNSAQLVEQPKKWDGKQITYTGEAITEALERGDMAWVHLNDDSYYIKNVEEGAALGGYNSGHAVWLPRTLAEKIRFWGDYTNEGDIVTVTGVFNAACGQHGGDMDIHATELEVQQVGHRVHEPVKPVKALIALALAALSAVLWLANRRLEHREAGGLLGR